METDLTLCVVTKNQPEHVLSLLHSAEKTADHVSYDIVVINNGPEDETGAVIKKEFPQAKVFENNAGEPLYTARNRAVSLAKGRYISFWQDDLLIQGDSLSQLVHFLDEAPDVGVALPRLILSSGEVLPSIRTFPGFVEILLQHTGLGRLFAGASQLKRHLMIEQDHLLSTEIDWGVGTVLIVRRETLEELARFDEEFISFYAEADFCLRAKRQGWHIHYLAETVIEHDQPTAYGPLHSLTPKPPHVLADCTRYLLKKWLVNTSAKQKAHSE